MSDFADKLKTLSLRAKKAGPKVTATETDVSVITATESDDKRDVHIQMTKPLAR